MDVIRRGSEVLRNRVGGQLFAQVAGPDGPKNRERIHQTPGPRWFGPERPIRVVHGDAAMFVGGLRALLLQSLHPLAMAAVAAHSGFRGDPWGRLARTSTFLAVTTYGTADDAGRAVAQVRAVHARVTGSAEDGRPYRADDPHLLAWVHAAEVDSFLAAHQAFGAHPLSPPECDAYVRDTARIATALGAAQPPLDVEQLRGVLDGFRPELRATAAARDAARFIVKEPPLPRAVRVPYKALTANAVALMPEWASSALGLPTAPRFLTPLTAPLTRRSGDVVTGLIRWAMAPPASSRTPPAPPGPDR
ncbi:oxygenase MpaB family protein [Streptomyces sp. NPDC058657]|uniref:oxygenase MpaB family protein n=1 Tax=unclassified Streptomyces TaxID=2593676 RepID=UPI0036592DA8